MLRIESQIGMIDHKDMPSDLLYIHFLIVRYLFFHQYLYFITYLDYKVIYFFDKAIFQIYYYICKSTIRMIKQTMIKKMYMMMSVMMRMPFVAVPLCI